MSLYFLEESEVRRHDLGARAVGMLSSMLRHREIASHHADDVRRIVDEWNATLVPHPEPDAVRAIVDAGDAVQRG